VNPAGPGSPPPTQARRPPRSLKARALQWLAQREHSRTELRRKLLRHATAESEMGASPAERDDPVPVAQRVEALLDWLEAHRYLSQERFAESRVHARLGRFGNRRIRQELAQHAVTLPAAAEQALKDSELGRAREVWRRRFGHPPEDASERARQARFLTGRGFSGEVVRRVLREHGTEDMDDDD
jgi:regulatory protein